VDTYRWVSQGKNDTGLNENGMPLGAELSIFQILNQLVWPVQLAQSLPRPQLIFPGQSELTATNAPVGRSVHWMGCVFSFGAGWGSSPSISFCC